MLRLLESVVRSGTALYKWYAAGVNLIRPQHACYSQLPQEHALLQRTRLKCCQGCAGRLGMRLMRYGHRDRDVIEPASNAAHALVHHMKRCCAEQSLRIASLACPSSYSQSDSVWPRMRMYCSCKRPCSAAASPFTTSALSLHVGCILVCLPSLLDWHQMAGSTCNRLGAVHADKLIW